METTKELFNKVIQPNIILDDQVISAFISKIQELENQEEHIDIGYYALPVDFFWGFIGDDTVEEGFIKMAKKDVLAIFNLLKLAGIEKSLYSICSIIQTHRCRALIIPTVEPTIEENLAFPNEFYELYKTLSCDIQEIKITTSKKNETCIIKTQALINIIVSSFKESILNVEEAVNYIYEIETGQVLDSLPENRLVDSAIVNLLIFIQTETDYKFNKEQGQSLQFSNKQFELIYELLVLGNLITEDNISSPPKDYIRIKVQRVLAKKPFIGKYFLPTEKKNVAYKVTPLSDKEHEIFDAAFNLQNEHKRNIAKNIQNILSQKEI